MDETKPTLIVIDGEAYAYTEYVSIRGIRKDENWVPQDYYREWMYDTYKQLRVIDIVTTPNVNGKNVQTVKTVEHKDLPISPEHNPIKEFTMEFFEKTHQKLS